MGIGQEGSPAAAPAAAGDTETQPPRAGPLDPEAVTRSREREDGQRPFDTDRLEPTEAALKPRSELTISLLRNIRYHEDRESFFGFWDRTLNFLVVLSGTAVVAAATHSDHPGRVAQAIAVCTTMIGSAQLVFDISKKQFLHEKLRTDFLTLLSKLTDENLADTKAEAAKLYGEESPTYYACDALAYNAAMRAMERPAEYSLRVNFWRRATRHRFRYADASFRELGKEGVKERWLRRWVLG